jgi:tRNA(Arg) A34 adenosine deaminase TadA
VTVPEEEGASCRGGDAVIEDACTEGDRSALLSAVRTARAAVLGGNPPFGAVVADASGEQRVSAGNTAVSTGEFVAHAEAEAARRAVRVMTTRELRGATLYSSAEPCAMCAAVVYWAGIGRVVYAVGVRQLSAMFGHDEEYPFLTLPCRTVFAAGRRPTRLVGPTDLSEAMDLWREFLGPEAGERT